MLSMLLALLMQASVSAPAGGAPSNLVVNPEWLRRPDYADVKRFYPEAAQKAFLTGRATIGCSVTTEGLLTECAVMSEDPVGERFGDAALRMSVLFKMQAPTRNGGPVTGGVIRVPIRFGLPPNIRSGAMRARVPALAGTTIELNCRFKEQRLDNCYSSGVPLPSPAVDAALDLASQVKLPPTPQPAGRIAISFEFVR